MNNEQRQTCNGCGQKIDPETCQCGLPVKNHSPYEGHPVVPMGCNCYRNATVQPQGQRG